MLPGKTLSSQGIIDDFWAKKLPSREHSTKALAVLPHKISISFSRPQDWRKTISTTSVVTSYDEAKTACKVEVARIVKECRYKNQKFSDIHFDLDNQYDSTSDLYVLGKSRSPSPSRPPNRSPSSPPLLRQPASVKRVSEIFDNPQFFVEETSAKNIHQGDGSTCWFVAALSTLRNRKPRQDLIKKICVERDEEVGVYGFLFFRDGQWIYVIVDDKLYLRTAEFEALNKRDRHMWEDNRVRTSAVEDYRKCFQTNSRALVYAHSSHPDETWVPLLEKAFAKAHGDYLSITSGSIGYGIEDLTGGRTTEIYTKDILSKNRLWEEGFCKMNEEFLFGSATPSIDDPFGEGRDGIYGDHAYSVLRAESYGKERLLMVMNPWGHAEWDGPWSDGSSQWTAEAVKDLGHVFGNDGVFWIRYEDFLRKFEIIYRTRLFTGNWNITQQWTRLVVPWSGNHQDIGFHFDITKATSAVVVLSQLDERYFRGLKGQYTFQISFQLYRSAQEEYILSSGPEHSEDDTRRSVSVELDLESGTYDVRLKVSAIRDNDEEKIEDVIKSNWLERRAKLLRIGLSHDLAHAMAQHEGNEEKGKAMQAISPQIREEALQANSQTNGEHPVPAMALDPILEERKQAGIERPEPRGRSREKDGSKQKKDKRDVSEEPWDATCVVGLRVYTLDSDATIEITDARRGKAENPETHGADGAPGEGGFYISSMT